MGGYEDERGDWLEVIAAQEELTNWQARLVEQIVRSTWQIIDLSNDKSSYLFKNTIQVWHKYEIYLAQMQWVQNTNKGLVWRQIELFPKIFFSCTQSRVIGYVGRGGH